MCDVHRDTGRKNIIKIPQIIPEVAAVNITSDALLKKHTLINKNISVVATCLIDTGATISVMNFSTWKKLGEPKIRASSVGNILLGNNAQVVPEGVCTTNIRIGDKEYPINLVVIKNWRYEVIIGLDFLKAIDAVLDIRKGSISVGKGFAVNAAHPAVQRNTRSAYQLVARESVVVKTRHECRVTVEISGAIPDGRPYLVDGKHVATGICVNDPYHEMVVFYRAGSMPHKIKVGDVIGKARPLLKSQADKIHGIERPGAINSISEGKDDASKQQQGGREEKGLDVQIQQQEVDLHNLRVGAGLNKKKFFHTLKKYCYAFDGKDPNLKELRERRRNKDFWNTEESKGKIFTPMDCMPVYIPQYRQSPILTEEAEKMNEAWLDAGLVRHSYSSWNSPVLLVPKPGGGLRFCVDYRRLNKITENDSYPMPRIDEILDSLGNAKIFSKMDIKWGFYNIELYEEDKAKTAYSLRSGHYEWNVLPMGLKNSPATFQRIMTNVLRPYIGKFVHVFVDDILIYSETPSQHFRHVELVVKALAENGFKISPQKSEFGMESLDYLGFQITSDKILPKTAQIDAILKMEQPKNISELRSFTGMCNVFRWQIKDFATLTAPLEDLKKKGMNVEKDWSTEHTNAFQAVKNKIAKRVGTYRVDWKKPIHFGSDASDTGIGAYVFQLDEEGNKRPIHFWSKKLTPTQKRYSTQERECFALIEGLKALHVYIDGRPFDIFMDHESLKYLMKARYTRKKMMTWAMELQEYQIRDIVHVPGETNLIPDALSRLPLAEFITEPWDEEHFADSTRYEGKKTVEGVEEDPSYVVNAMGVFKPVKAIAKSERLREEQRKDSFLSKIIDFLENKFDFNDPDAKMITSMSSNFTIADNRLYFLHKQRFKPLQKRLCIPEVMKKEILEQIHEGCGHQGIHRTYELLHDRYWWRNMFKDVCEHIQGCECRLRKLRSNPFNEGPTEHIVVTERWHTIAIDWLEVGRRGKYGSTKVLTIVDLCTRYSLAIPATDKSGASLVRILRTVFALNGYPARVVSDNESMFRSKEFEDWLKVKGIEKSFTAVYNPKANGIDERFNQTLMDMINSTSAGREWDVDVWELFYYYNLVSQATTGESPFYLHFIRQGRLPVDISYKSKEDDEFFSIKDIVHKSVLEESRAMEKALKTVQEKHGKLDQRKKMPKFKPFKVGDVVIQKEPNLNTAAKRKPIGTGPWTIHRVMGRNTYKLKDSEGKKCKFLVNGRRLAMIRPRRHKRPDKDEGELEYFDMVFFPEESKPVQDPLPDGVNQASEGNNDGGLAMQPTQRGQKTMTRLEREAEEAKLLLEREKRRATRRKDPVRTVPQRNRTTTTTTKGKK